MSMTLEILYEDESLLLCRKPPGVAAQTSRVGQQDMVSMLRCYRAEREEDSYIGVVHRLDQPVEGVMVFAKDRRTAAALSEQVAQRRIGKHYYAVGVCAEQEPESLPRAGVLTDYMDWERRTNLARIVNADEHQKGKKAVLDYRILAIDGDRVLFDIQLHTGRHHQIRLQLAHWGCPILGDGKYGRRNGGLALCAYRLQLDHPATGERIDVSLEPRNPEILRLLSKSK